MKHKVQKHHPKPWRQTGCVALWRYRDASRHYAGWHLSADDAGCQSIKEWLDILATNQAKANIAIQISRPSSALLQVPNCRGGSASTYSPVCLRLNYQPTENVWLITKVMDEVELTIGCEWLKQLAKGIEGILQGNGDYSIGHDDYTDKQNDSRLWFWWHPQTS